jgi:3-oxoacyl-[acyl-carrier protein] reductase
MPSTELEDKVSLVTGASRGIGKAIAIKLAEMGSKVAVNDLPGNPETENVIQTIRNLGGEAVAAPADVTQGRAVKAAVNSIEEQWGKIDILVNNAGILRRNLLLRLSEEDWDAVLDTNLKGAYLCTHYALRLMLGQKWGRVINIASVAGVMGNMGDVSYSASKGGLIAFTRSLAPEVGSRNITVNAIAPGYISTDLSESISLEAKNIVLSRTAIKRAGTPQDVAELAGFLASDRSNYITGQVICIDGGISY